MADRTINIAPGRRYQAVGVYAIDGVPQDISAAVAITLVVRTTPSSDSELMVSAGLGTGITRTDTGTFAIDLDDAATVGMASDGYHEITIEITAGNTVQFQRGPAKRLPVL